MQNKFRIIDFHTHPFTSNDFNICSHTEYCNMSQDSTKEYFKALSIEKICGSVIKVHSPDDTEENMWERTLLCNDVALKLQKDYGDFYIPGFHIHPDFVKDSCEEIERMHSLNVNLIGELVPYHFGWDYSHKGLDEIIDLAEQYNMIISFHSMDDEYMDSMVKNHPNTIFVAAHPGGYDSFMRHLDRMKMSENYYLDLSGTGLFRLGLLRHGIDEFGKERFIFGSDYPTCTPAMFLGGVVLEPILTDEEKQAVLFDNAKRLLKL